MDTSNEYIVEGEVGKNLNDNFSPLVENVMKSHELAGLAIGIVADTEIVYAKGFGVKSLETREPVSTTTIFHMASISKPFVATAIMQLVEKAQVQLDAPVITYLPYFKLDDERYSSITVQQMLSHVSGMPDVEDYEWDKPQYDEGALERYVRGLTSQKLLSEPGARFAYSNMAFECLGDVIAKVSGMSFDDYVKKHILNPSGMAQSSFLKPEHLPTNWATPHVRALTTLAWQGYPYNRRHGPSSALHSSAFELSNWAITNLRRGSFKGKQILSPSSYDILYKPWVEIGKGEQMGLSWFLQEYRGERVIRHSGSDIGFMTHLVMLPDKRAAVVVLCNSMPAPGWEIVCSALDMILGYEPDPIIPQAGLIVCKTLSEQGLDAAVAQWDSLKSNHPDEYDFDQQQFSNLFTAMSVERVQDAESIARLCARILPGPDVRATRDALERYQNKYATIVLRAIREEEESARA